MDIDTVEAIRDDIEYSETDLGGFAEPSVAASYVPIGRVYSTTLLLMRVADPPSREVFSLFMEDPAAPELLTRSLPELLARIVTEPI